jgi:hypothetical protein
VLDNTVDLESDDAGRKYPPRTVDDDTNGVGGIQNGDPDPHRLPNAEGSGR